MGRGVKYENCGRGAKRLAGSGWEEKWRWKNIQERLSDAFTPVPKCRYICIKCLKNEVTKEIKVCKECTYDP